MRESVLGGLLGVYIVQMTFWSYITTPCQRHLVVHLMSWHVTFTNAVLTVARLIYQTLTLFCQLQSEFLESKTAR